MSKFKILLFLIIFSFSFSANLVSKYNNWQNEITELENEEIYRDFPTDKEFNMYKKLLKYRCEEAKYQDFMDKNMLENRFLETEIYRVSRKPYYYNNYYFYDNYYNRGGEFYKWEN